MHNTHLISSPDWNKEYSFADADYLTCIGLFISLAAMTVLIGFVYIFSASPAGNELQLQRAEYPSHMNSVPLIRAGEPQIQTTHDFPIANAVKVQSGISGVAPLHRHSPPLAYPLVLSSPIGLRIDPITQKEAHHHGIDLKAAYGTPIFASAEGLVVRAGWDKDYGYVVEIEHPHRMISRYAHAMELLVKKGDAVYRQQIIAKVGSTGKSTGPHLHYELFQRREPSWQ